MSSIPIHPTLPEICPWCAKRLNATASFTTDRAPKPGDWSLCWGCLRPLVFDENGRRRKATPEEVAAFDADPTVRILRHLARESAYPDDAVRAMRQNPDRT